jgi:hypothetical protein
VTTLRYPTADSRHHTISIVLGISLDLLDAASRRRLIELSIFPEDVGIPLAATSTGWNLDEIDSEELAMRLARLSLIKLDLQSGVLRLHDVMRSGWPCNRLLHETFTIDSWMDGRTGEGCPTCPVSMRGVGCPGTCYKRSETRIFRRSCGTPCG